jgi:hypothetical protein
MPLAARRPQGPEDDRLSARTGLIALLLLPLAAAAADVHPLLEFARERAETRDRDTRNIGRTAGVSEAEHSIEQRAASARSVTRTCTRRSPARRPR